jgi:hypothetical protein
VDQSFINSPKAFNRKATHTPNSIFCRDALDLGALPREAPEPADPTPIRDRGIGSFEFTTMAMIRHFIVEVAERRRARLGIGAAEPPECSLIRVAEASDRGGAGERTGRSSGFTRPRSDDAK